MTPLNGNRAFEGLRLRLVDGEVLVGCRDDERSGDDATSIFLPEEVLPRRVPHAAVAVAVAFPLPEAPESTYAVTYQKTGGVSSAGSENDAYHRRHVVAAEPVEGRASLVLVNPPAEALAHFLRTYVDVERVEDREDDEGNVFVTATTPGDTIQHTIFAAAKAGLECVSLARRQPTILCDTLFRAMHTYAQQTKFKPMHEVGATRDTWRFCMEHVPRDWLDGHLAPFTWEAYARHVFRTTPRHRLGELPQPLQHIALREGYKAADEVVRACHAASVPVATAAAAAGRRHAAAQAEAHGVGATLRAMQACLLSDVGRWTLECTLLAGELDAAHAEAATRAAECAAAARRRDEFVWRTRESALAKAHIGAMQPVGKPRLRCPPLTEAMQAQCIHLFHCLKYGADFLSTDEAAASRAALLQFALRNGTVPRLVTVYEKTNQFVGFGERLRAPPADADELPPEVRNRCRVRNGELVGGGGQGCKGIVYAPKEGKKVYRPVRQHKRSVDDHERMGRKRLRRE